MQNRPPQGVIFDLDGTLLDTLEDIAAAMNQALGALGEPQHGLEDYRGFIGEGVRVLAERAAPALAADAARLEALIEIYRGHYADQLVGHTRPYPGIDALVDALAARGVPLGVLSNKPDAPTRALVERFFPGRFRVAWGQREGVPRKPDPTAAIAIAGELGVAPATTFFVGDTGIDMRTAVAAGMVPVGVAWGFRPEELRATGAARVLERAEELLDYLPSR
jgi:phosphoglycolate phosphatase